MSDAASLEQHLQQKLQLRKQQSLYRQRRVITQTGIKQKLEGKPLINFCSNDYLGLSQHPAVTQAFRDTARKYGVGSGAAHLVSGHHAEHHALEEELAEFLRYPRALLFSTGYMANLGVLNALLERQDGVFQDRLNHASLIDASQLGRASLYRYQHNDMHSLVQQLNNHSVRYRMIVTDAVFSMDGDLAPVDQLADIANSHSAWLMLDDAHGLGVLGKAGRGSVSHWQLSTDKVPIYMATLGKALGVYGAVVAGSDTLIESLIQDARSYVYTTALPPAVAAAVRCSIGLLQTESWRQQKLHDNIQYFRQGAAQLGLPVMPSCTAIQPLLLKDSAKALCCSQCLFERGIWVSAIRPPTVPAQTARLRITLSAAHEQQDIDKLLETLSQCLPGRMSE